MLLSPFFFNRRTVEGRNALLAWLPCEHRGGKSIGAGARGKGLSWGSRLETLCTVEIKTSVLLEKRVQPFFVWKWTVLSPPCSFLQGLPAPCTRVHWKEFGSQQCCERPCMPSHPSPPQNEFWVQPQAPLGGVSEHGEPCGTSSHPWPNAVGFHSLLLCLSLAGGLLAGLKGNVF